MTYEEFLNEVGVLSEETFDEIIDLFPEVDIDDCNIYDMYEFNDPDELCRLICNAILTKDFKFAYCESANFQDKTLELWDIPSKEDLEKVKEIFSNWEITNYEDIISAIKEEEKSEKEQNDRVKLLEILRINATNDDLRKIVKEYGYKK